MLRRTACPIVLRLPASAALLGWLSACNQLVGNVPLDLSRSDEAGQPDAASCQEEPSRCEPEDAGPIDPCADQPCVHGSCRALDAGFRCDCPSGYDGPTCAHAIEGCSAKPCVRGSCMNLQDGAYECACPAGYDGDNCEHDIDECAPKPCVHGTCSDKVNAYQCSCSPGWGGATCAAGSCSNVSCASTAPCTVPSGNAGLCLPTACGTQPGLCLAYNPDGGGNASTELLTETNDDWNFGTDNNWNDKARYFSYVHAIGSFPYVCVFPQKNLGGTPIVIPLGQSRSAPAGFGQSNAFSNVTQCSAHPP